jgi:ankyrin repeat protein/tetratricopeptide (TPR) repeat protein
MLAAGCAVKTEPPFPQKEYDEFIAQGDARFAKMHLYAWRKADEWYAKAYEMNKTPELRDKRFLTLCLTAVREKDERVINPGTYEKIDGLGDFEKNEKQQYFFDIVNHYRTAPLVRNGDKRLHCKEKKEIAISLFDIENSPLDAYLYLYFLKYYYTYDRSVYSEEVVRLFNKHKITDVIGKHTDSLSPLFIYSNFKAMESKKEDIEAMYPRFAEFFILKGNGFYRQNKLKTAAAYYQKALEIIPTYTTALTGLGNIYYFTVKDYEKAITYYDKTLAIDNLAPVALFGKAVSLHHLERYEESDAVLDFMLENQPKHHGEAWYYKAYNRYKENEPLKARPLVDKAIKLMPRTGEIHFLSGLLNYNEGKLKEARTDFQMGIFDPRYSNCYPLYYLGLISLKENRWRFLRDFPEAIQCLKNGETVMRDRLNAIDAMDLGDREKEYMKKRHKKNLADFIETSGRMIQQMTSILEANKGRKKLFDKQVKNKALSDVKNLLKKDPGQLNKLDKEGSGLLHKAIENRQPAVAKYLLLRGARMDIPNSIGYRPLHWAVMLGQTEIVKLLIRHGADVNAAKDDMTPLHDAAHGGHREIARVLLAAGADPYARTGQGKTPLNLAVEQNQTKLYEMLRPLHKAVEKGDPDKIKTLLKKDGELMDSGDEKNRTPLAVAAARGHKELVRFLVNNGANVNAKDINGCTPLMRAKQKGHVEIVNMLLAKGADIPDEEILKKQLQDKEAAAWYLNDHGWAVKTKNRFLVFDYRPVEWGFRYRKPDELRLSNGYINPAQIKDQWVTVFVSGSRVNYRDPNLVFTWRKTIPAINYFFSREAAATAMNHKPVILEGREKKELDGLEVQAVDAAAGALGYLIKADGLTILFNPGTDMNFSKERWETFTKEIDYLAQTVSTIDIMFLPLTTEAYKPPPTPGEKFDLDKGTLYILEKLRPKLMFPLPYGLGELPVKAFAEKLSGKGIKTLVRSFKNRGDRFIISNDK